MHSSILSFHYLKNYWIAQHIQRHFTLHCIICSENVHHWCVWINLESWKLFLSILICIEYYKAFRRAVCKMSLMYNWLIIQQAKNSKKTYCTISLIHKHATIAHVAIPHDVVKSDISSGKCQHGKNSKWEYIFTTHLHIYRMHFINGREVSSFIKLSSEFAFLHPDQKPIKHKPQNNSSGCHSCRRSLENTAGTYIKQTGTQTNLALALRLIDMYKSNYNWVLMGGGVIEIYMCGLDIAFIKF